MSTDEKPVIRERSPEAVLQFWFGPMRTTADASRENWQRGMQRWRVGPFARATLDADDLRAQREWCDQMHREGLDRFFQDPAWDTPKGLLAKLIVLDQFPRSVYRGTALAYANDPETSALARRAFDTGWELTQYNAVERLWLYFPLCHVEDLNLQEVCVEKVVRWSADLVSNAPADRRRINQFVAWSFVKGAIEHSETLLLFGRFPHRNAALLRPHRGGERSYLTDPKRPVWSFTQTLDPGYFALMGALLRIADGPDEDRIDRNALGDLLAAAGERADTTPMDPMDVFDLAGGDTVPYATLYRHLRLPEHAPTFEALQQLPLVADLRKAVKGFVLRSGDRSWPPRRNTPAIDVAGLAMLVRGGERSTAYSRLPDDREGTPTEAPPPVDPARSVSLAVPNDRSGLAGAAEAIDDLAHRHGFPQQDRFEVQLCVEETLMYIVDYADNESGAQPIEIHLEMDEEDRSLVIRFVDEGRELDPGSFMFQPGAETIEEETVVAGLGLHLVRTYVDDLRYRREDGRNHLTLSKQIGVR